MKDAIAGMASKKLAVAGSVLALIVHDAETRGWTAAHLLAVAIIVGCYCLAQAFDDGMTSHGYETKRTAESADPQLVAPVPVSSPKASSSGTRPE